MSSRSPLIVLLSCLSAALPTAADDGVEIAADVPAGLPSVARVVPVTRGPKHHFVGYYGITPFDAADRRLFCLQATFGDRLVRAEDRAAVCLVDPASGAAEPVAETAAWNLQQGAMLHWLPTAPDREIVYNDRVDGKLVSVVLDVVDKRRRLIDRPIAAVAPDGRTAVGLNYERLRQIRPVTGYAGGPTTGAPEKRPADDGLYVIDMTSGRGRLLLSVDDVCRATGVPAEVAGQPIWLEHPAYSRDGSRLFFMARAFHPQSRRIVSVPITARAADGADLRPLLPWAASGASHYDWLDARRLALTREVEPKVWRHLLLGGPDDPPTGRPLAETVLTRDGHCTFSPDGRWMVTDSYPDEQRRQHLYVMEVATGRAARIASFLSPPQYRGDWRCDLHPRWDRQSRRICIDSTHEGVRQVYLIDLRMP